MECIGGADSATLKFKIAALRLDDSPRKIGQLNPKPIMWPACLCYENTRHWNESDAWRFTGSRRLTHEFSVQRFFNLPACHGRSYAGVAAPELP